MSSRVTRTAPQFQRIVKPYRDAFMILIASEGQKTEELYFSFPFLSHRRVKILPIPSQDGCSAPAYVLDNLKNTAKQLDLGKQDRLWLAIDRDRWKEQQIREVMGKKIRNIPIKVALSNPCFELWLYLHFAPMPAEPMQSSQEMESKLRTVKGSYSKTSLKAEEFEPGLVNAMEEAEKTSTDSDGIPNNPGTHVHRILKEIKDLK